MDKHRGRAYISSMTSELNVRFLDRTTPPHIFTLILIAGVSALAMNIFLPSLPNMTNYFDTEYRIMQLSVPIYFVVNAALQLVVGPISDRYGRRPIVLIGMAVFTLASIGCVYAQTVEMFLLYRMIQATVVVGIVLSRAIVRDIVGGEKSASMIGYVTMGMAVVPMIGPAIGGVLDEFFNWQANFVLLAVLGAATVAICFFDLKETATSRSTSFAEQFRQYPELLTSRRFWGYCLAAAFGSGAFFAYLGGAPYIGSELFHLTPSVLGYYFGAPALGYFAGNYVTARYVTYFGINGLIVTGGAILVAGMALSLVVFYLGFGSAPMFFGLMTFIGLGNGLVMPNANAGLLGVRPHLAGSASGLGGAIMIGGGAGLSALAGAVLKPGTGAYPLLWIMFITSLLSLASILYVLRREKELGVS